MNYGYVYRTVNTLNGMSYIGQTTKPESKEYFGSGLYLKRALEKYGRSNFRREILEYASSKEELDELERKYIKEFDAIESDNFYNFSCGGQGGNLGEKVNKKISKKCSGSGNGMYGKTYKHTTEAKERIRQANIGKTYSQETLDKIKTNTKKAMQDPSLRKMLSEKMKAHHSTLADNERKELNNKRSKTMSEYYNSESGIENKKSLSEKMSGKKNPFYGKKHKILTCPYCNKSGANGAMQRWHFENCKRKTE